MIFCFLGTAFAFLFVSFCVLRNWLGNRPIGTGRQKYASHLQLGSYQLLPVLKGIVCLSPFWLSLGVALCLGRTVFFVSSLRTPHLSLELYRTARNVDCLPQLKPDKVFKRIFFKSSSMIMQDQKTFPLFSSRFFV